MEDITLEYDIVAKIGGFPFVIKAGTTIRGRRENLDAAIAARGHLSSCPVNNGPALEPGPCNCGYEKSLNMNIKDNA